MARALWNGVVLAESDAPKLVEGNLYFPPESVDRDHLRPSTTHTRCYWKGKASYYDVVVGDVVIPDAAWFYPAPWPLARTIRDHVAFTGTVEIQP